MMSHEMVLDCNVTHVTRRKGRQQLTINLRLSDRVICGVFLFRSGKTDTVSNSLVTCNFFLQSPMR